MSNLDPKDSEDCTPAERWLKGQKRRAAKMVAVPDVIHIQFWGDIDRPEDEMYDPDWEATWCDHEVNDSDICYIRESEVAAALARAEDERRKLEEALNEAIEFANIELVGTSVGSGLDRSLSDKYKHLVGYLIAAALEGRES